MWKDYSSGYIKNNRFLGMSVRISAFICALLLSLLCGLFYNMWKYEVERIELEEGGWQSRLIGEFSKSDVEIIENFANVKEAVLNENKDAETSIDIYFDDMKSVFPDTPHIASQIGVSPEKIVYNYALLAMYLIRGEGDRAPRLVFPLFLVIMLMAVLSLIIIIHNAFAVSMNVRVYQLGIFSSIGATPKQIRSCLLQEAAALCAAPVIAGTLLGIAGSMGLIKMSNVLLGSDIPGRHKAVFGYHPLVLVLTLFVTIATIWISAWLPARNLSKLTPLEAIRNTGELQLKRRKNSRLLTFLFGVEGELAGNALKAQKKALRTASLSFILSFMAFAIMECFFSLSEISTRETYFERYQDVWDVMVTLKNTKVDDFEDTEKVRQLAGVQSAIVYQKATAKRIITEEEMSEEMKAFGGFPHASYEGGWLVNVPIVILDDNSFLSYCRQLGIMPRLDGAVILNQIRDVTNPDFRHPVYVSYVNETGTTVLRQSGNEETTAEIPVLSYTKEAPALREEYAKIDYYELVHFMPASVWREIRERIGGMEEDSYICVKAGENVSLEELNGLENEIAEITGGKYTIEQENRIQEYETNEKQIQGMEAVLGGFCSLLAIIGIGNVFSNTLGFVRQRKREFARYMSIGLTPKELKKMFCVEALVIAGKPFFISLPIVLIAVGYLLRLSYVEPGIFMPEAPLVPILIFMLAILGSVALAYYLAWRNVQKISLAEVLRDNTLM
ncbi:MAG: ABC transporter permease [Eubacteriales bacterium]|nr:ABC transporter permease [Eubacteriales bacterium]